MRTAMPPIGRENGLNTSAENAHLRSSTGDPAPRWLRVGFWVCTLIAVAAVVRRISALAFPSSSGPPQLVELDRIFAFHAALTLAHILPALAFVLIAPFAVFRRFSRLTWPERWLFPLGAIVGITAYAMSVYSIGVLKSRWLIRAIAVLLGIATTQPAM